LTHFVFKGTRLRFARLRGNKALLRLRCPLSGPCRGVARLSAKRGPRAERLLGKRAFHIAAGKHLTLAIELRPSVRALLSSVGRKGLAARLTGAGVVRGTVRLRRWQLAFRPLALRTGLPSLKSPVVRADTAAWSRLPPRRGSAPRAASP
jgi:hypothetical protein